MERPLTAQEQETLEHHRRIREGLVAQVRERERIMSECVREFGGVGAEVDLENGRIKIPDDSE